jgi:hypothetical protein
VRTSVRVRRQRLQRTLRRQQAKLSCIDDSATRKPAGTARKTLLLRVFLHESPALELRE